MSLVFAGLPALSSATFFTGLVAGLSPFRMRLLLESANRWPIVVFEDHLRQLSGKRRRIGTASSTGNKAAAGTLLGACW